MAKPNLFLLTTAFPYSVEESGFLTDEIPEILRNFNVSIISRNTKDPQFVELPSEVNLFRYNAHDNYRVFPLLIKTLYSRIFWSEQREIIKQGFKFSRVIRSFRVHMRALHYSKFLGQVRSTISKDEQVLFYSYWNQFYTLSCLFAKQKNDMIITRLHGGDLYRLPYNGMYQAYKANTAPRIDKLFFISEAGLNYYNDTYCQLGSKAEIARLGTRKHKIKYTFEKRNNIKIYSFSYVRDIKRIDLIIDALSQIEGVEVEWTHIGARYLYEEIKQYAFDKLNSKKNIKYLFVGEMKNEDALDYISSHEYDFLINVSSTEGLPVTMMEAMSMKIPVIGTNVGGVSEIVKDSFNGYILDKDFKVSELVDILTRYSQKPYDEKKEMRDNAYSMWEENFSSLKNYHRFSDRLLEIYNEHKKCK